MWWRDDRDAGALSGELGVTVRLRRAQTPMAEAALTGGERRQWQALPTDARRRDWLLGRTALRSLLRPASDTSGLTFPHPHLSLTHAGGLAVAVGSSTGGVAVAGTGVDHEPWRAVDPRTARFFLAPRERSTSLGVLRAWTVKEALYKALPDNQGHALVDIDLDQPDAPSGAARGPSGEHLRYAVVDTADGPLAAAVCLTMEALTMEALTMEDCRVAV